MAGITAIKRKGFKGGGFDASKKDFSESYDRQSVKAGLGDPNTRTGARDNNEQFVESNPLTGRQMRDAANAYKIGTFKPKELPAFIPGSSFFKILRNVVPGDSKKRMDYINRLDPKARKAMMDRLGLYSDEDYETEEEYLAAMGKDLSGSNALDIINYDGEYMKQFGPKLVNNINRGDVSTLPYSVNEQILPVVDDTIPYRLGDPNKGKALDVTLGRYFNQGGRVPRNMGGIMNAVPRQGYFLGGIGKSIGKAFKGVAKAAGKVLKSDVGKMAIAGLGAYYLGGGKMFGLRPDAAGFKFGNIGGGITDIGKKLLLKDSTGDFTKDNFSFMKMLSLSGALPFLPGLNDVKQDPSLIATRKNTGLIDPLTKEEATPAEMRENIELAKLEAAGDPDKLDALNKAYNNMLFTTEPYPNYSTYVANGGRIGFEEGGGIMDLGDMENMMMASNPSLEDSRNEMMENIAMEEYGKPLSDLTEDEIIQIEIFMEQMDTYGSSSIMDKYKRYIQEMINTGNKPLDFEEFKKMIEESEKTIAKPLPSDPTKPINPFQPKPTGPVLPDREMVQAGGRIGYMGGGMTMGDPRMMMPQSRMPMEEGGLMDLGGMEKDYRAEGGFVPIGREEKADDVPARLSVNEFVFTADAVRNAGGGDIDRGAEVMENMMKNLENGGRVSEESQGNTGAQEMFSVSERIGEVI